MRKIKMAADFRIYHVSDGATVAESISKKFTGERYNLVVELYDLQRRSSSFSGSSNSSSQTSSISMSKADISVLLVTPAMIKFLKGATDDDRTFTHILDPGKKPLVALSCFVPVAEVKILVAQMFPDPTIQWRYLDVGDKSETFNQCMIGLLSLLEEQQEPMPVPKLKKCHLLPDTPVMAGDTIYILLESPLAASGDSSSLILLFENECQIQAKKISDSLYEFQTPECSYYKLAVEIFSISGESFGSEEIIYKDKRDIMASILADVVNPIEFMAQALQLNDTMPDVLDSKLSNWFKYKTSSKPYTELQKLLARWVKSLRCDNANTSQELPTLLHLAAKYNLTNLAQTLLLQPWGTTALKVKNKDGHTPGQLALKYYHIGLSDFLVAESEAEESSFEEDGESYINPEYCAPGAINVINTQPNVLEMKFESMHNLNLKRSDYSIPVEEGILLEPNGEVQGYPSPCMKQLSTSDYMNMAVPQLQPTHSRKPLLGKAIAHGRYHSLDSSDLNQGASNITSPPNLLQRALSERSSSMSPRSSGESSGGRPATPPRPAQMLKVFISPDNNGADNQFNANKEPSEPSLFKKNSKKGNNVKPCKSRRSSISMSQFYTPRHMPLKSSQSLSRLNEISLIEEVPEPASKQSPENNTRFGLTGSPKPCYPLSNVPPPLPTTSPPPFTSISATKYSFYGTTSSNGVPPIPEKAPMLPAKLHTVHRQIALKRYHFGKNGSFSDVSPDYSQPINVHFEDPIPERDFSTDYITPKLDQLNESIYEEVDIKSHEEMIKEDEEGQLLRHKTSRGRQSFRKIILVESESTTESLKQLQSDVKPQPESPTATTPVTTSTATTSTTSSAASSSGVSTAVSSPTSPTIEEQPKSPSIFSSISSKFSRSKSKQYRSSKDHVTKM